jgi:hypothetical protein
MFERRYPMNCGRFAPGARTIRWRWLDANENAKSSTP